MKDRITKFLTTEHISPTEFADKIGVQRSSISHVLTGRNYPSASFIQKMLVTFPHLNARWLLLGDGDMLTAKIPSLEPSLFDMPVISEKIEIKEVIPKKEEKISIPDISDDVTEPSIVRGSEKMETKVKKDNPSNENDIKITDNKEIDKIIVLYKDKTFTCYTPS
jgi:transcriptional regulator with XRE-family HTH domain